MKLVLLEKQTTALIPLLLLITKTFNKYPHHKHLGIVLDLKLDFKFHVDQKIKII